MRLHFGRMPTSQCIHLREILTITSGQLVRLPSWCRCSLQSMGKAPSRFILSTFRSIGCVRLRMASVVSGARKASGMIAAADKVIVRNAKWANRVPICWLVEPPRRGLGVAAPRSRSERLGSAFEQFEEARMRIGLSLPGERPDNSGKQRRE